MFAPCTALNKLSGFAFAVLRFFCCVWRPTNPLKHTSLHHKSFHNNPKSGFKIRQKNKMIFPLDPTLKWQIRLIGRVSTAKKAFQWWMETFNRPHTTGSCLTSSALTTVPDDIYFSFDKAPLRPLGRKTRSDYKRGDELAFMAINHQEPSPDGLGINCKWKAIILLANDPLPAALSLKIFKTSRLI